MSTANQQQFQFCSLCHLSHTCGKKHVYSKKHKLLLDKALKRFDEKISLCKKAIEKPSVINLCNDKMQQQNVWCYFCSVETERHSITGNYLIMEHNLLAHLTTELHKINTRLFFQKNFLKQYNKYIFTETEFERHNATVLVVTKDLEIQFRGEIFEKMKDIYKTESQKYSLASHFSEANNTTSQPLKPHVTAKASSSTFSQFKKTIAAFGEGLTYIKMKRNKNIIPNVHSGGLPPWMQICDKSTEHQAIGPGMVDYQKHLTAIKMSKLPKERVGANISKEMPVNGQWLPSFGCVWNNHRRLDTKHQFLKRKTNMFGKRPMKTGKSAAASTTPQSKLHKINTRLFFQKNFLKQYNKYIFTETEFERHNATVLVVTKDLEIQFRGEIFEKMKDIYKTESQKYSLASHFSEANNTTSQPLKPHVTAKASSSTFSQFKKTIAAFGEGLTYIKMKRNKNIIPNVHSGGLPPWMQICDKSTEHQAIGPGMVDYQKHLTAIKMSKLPKERVGANISKEMPVNGQWLPSFGCVWNNHRRLDTKHQFLKRKTNMFGKRPMKTGKSAAASTTPQSSMSGRNVSISPVIHVVPYKRKRCVTQFNNQV